MTKKHGLGLDSDYMARMDAPRAEPLVVPADFRLTEDDARALAEGQGVVVADVSVQSTVLGLIDRLTRADQTHEISSAIQCLRNASKWLAEHEAKTTATD